MLEKDSIKIIIDSAQATTPDDIPTSLTLSVNDTQVESGDAITFSGTLTGVGAGGLGCPLLLYLAYSGVGNLGIVDHDKVELSNLSRQILFTKKDI